MKIRRAILLSILAVCLLCFAFSTGAQDKESTQLPDDPNKSRSYLLTGKLDKTVPFAALPDGSVQELLNMTRPAPGIPMGWKARGGVTKHNTTPIGNVDDYIVVQDRLTSASNLSFDTNQYAFAQAFLMSGASGYNGDLEVGFKPFVYGTPGGAIYVQIREVSGTTTPASGPIVNANVEFPIAGVSTTAQMASVFMENVTLVSGQTYFITFKAASSYTYANNKLLKLKAQNTAVGGDALVGDVLWTANNGTSWNAVNTCDIVLYVKKRMSVKSINQITNSDLGFSSYFTHAGTSIFQITTAPPSTSGSIGTFMYNVPSGTSPLFGDRVGDDYVWAGTGTTPIAYSGASAYPDGCYVMHETGNTVYDSGWRKVRDNRQDTNLTWVAHSGSSEYAYIGFRRRLSGYSLDLLTGATNIMAAGTTVAAYRSGSWIGVAGFTDGTKSSNGVTTLYQSGHVSWTASDLDTPHVLPGTKEHLFWYRTGVTADVTDGVKVWRVKVNDRMEPITSLWSGLYDTALGCMTSSTTGFVDWTAEVTTGSDAEYADLGGLANTQYLYVGFANPAFGIWVNIVSEYENNQTACGLSIYYWNAASNAWTEITGVTSDGTSSGGMSLNHAGIIQWDGQNIREDMRTLGGRTTPLYWYRLRWNQTLPTSGVYIWEVGEMQKPETVPPMPEYDGVFEYNGRAAFWPGVRYRHGIDFSQDFYPHIMTGAKTTSTGNIFGPGIPNSAVRFSSYAVVSTKDPYRLYLLEGKVPGKFDELLLSDKVGAVASHSMIVIEDAVKIFQTTRVVHAVALMAPDGAYMTQGQNVVKISQPISNYWDTNNSEYIEPSYMHLIYSWVDYQEKTVHWAVPMHLSGGSTQTTLNRELVYSYIADEWYDLHHRYSPARCGADIIGSDNQRMAYLGDYNGYVYRSGVSTTDAGQIITHHVKTADFIPAAGQLSDALNYSSILRAIKTKTKAQTVGDVEVVMYPDGYTSGVTPTGGNTISMIKSGYGYSYGRINTNQKGESFALRFRSGVSTAELGTAMEIHGFSVDYYPLRDTQVGGN